jgi:hypothetical protein
MERLVSPRQRAPRGRRVRWGRSSPARLGKVHRICAGREKRKKASFTTETRRRKRRTGYSTRRRGPKRTFALPSFLHASVSPWLGFLPFLAGCDCTPREVPRDRPQCERARGGIGLIITGSTSVHPRLSSSPRPFIAIPRPTVEQRPRRRYHCGGVSGIPRNGLVSRNRCTLHGVFDRLRRQDSGRAAPDHVGFAAGQDPWSGDSGWRAGLCIF